MDVSKWAGFYEAATLTSVTVAGKKVMQILLSASNHQTIALTGKTGTDGRILMRARQTPGGTSTARTFGISMRVGGDTSDRRQYIMRITSSGINISRVSGSGVGTLTSNVTSATIANTIGTWYWFDVKIDGGRIQFQVWPDGEKRPEGWRLTGNMGTYASGGYGFYASTTLDSFQVSHFVSTFK